MKIYYLALCLLFLITPFVCESQLSGLSLAHGNDFQVSPKANGEFIHANAYNIDRHQYIGRFCSVAVNYKHSSDNLNFDSINQYNNHRFGLSMSYWYLSDFRLLGKMARSSCKGKLVAML